MLLYLQTLILLLQIKAIILYNHILISPCREKETFKANLTPFILPLSKDLWGSVRNLKKWNGNNCYIHKFRSTGKQHILLWVNLKKILELDIFNVARQSLYCYYGWRTMYIFVKMWVSAKAFTFIYSKGRKSFLRFQLHMHLLVNTTKYMVFLGKTNTRTMITGQ